MTLISEIQKIKLLTLVLACSLVFPQISQAKEKWAVTVYGAYQTEGDIWSTFYSPDFQTSYQLIALALSRNIFSVNRHLDIEIEGQAVKHLGEQHHWEFNGLLALRWLTFPWNNYINTTFAVGDGLSYATSTPKVEEQLHENTSLLLNYTMFELTFGLPESPRWNLVLRVHHRSGVFGLFNGVSGASNALGLGVKYKF